METSDNLIRDWKKLLSKFAPNLVNLYGPNNRAWRNIEKKMGQRYRVFNSQIQKSETWTTATNIFDLAMIANTESHQDSQISKSFLQFIDKLSLDLSRITSDKLHLKAKRQLKDLFVNFDVTQSKYLEKIGELAFTLYTIRTTKGELVDIERNLPNNKKIDLVLRLPGRQSEMYIDIFNININDTKLNSEVDLEAFLNKRIADKIKSKQPVLERHKRNMLIQILPVLWCNLSTLLKFRNYLVNRHKHKPQELICCSFLQLSDDKGNYYFKYGSVNYLLKMSDRYETKT